MNMGKVRIDRRRAFRTLAGLAEAVELEGIIEFRVVRCDGIWFLTYAVEVLNDSQQERNS